MTCRPTGGTVGRDRLLAARSDPVAGPWGERDPLSRGVVMGDPAPELVGLFAGLDVVRRDRVADAEPLRRPRGLVGVHLPGGGEAGARIG